MHRKFPLLLAMPLLAMVLTAATAPASAPLQPAGPWKIDYAPNECRLVRTFGTGDGAITLRFARGAGLDSFDMLIAGKALPKIWQAHIPVTLRLDPSGAEQVFDGYAMAVPDRPERFVRWYDGTPDILDGVTDGQQLQITVGDKFVLTINLAKGASALKGLNHCHTELLKGWGIDPAQMTAQAVPPKPRISPANWVRSGDYPSGALLAGKQGTILAILTVSATGKVTECRAAVSSGVALLDEKTCQVLRGRGSYHPARNRAGAPIVGFDVQRIRWLIPED